MINEKISVYINLFSDLGFLDDIIENIYNKVDEIIIIDGPYKYNIDTLRRTNLLYDEHTKPDELNNILNKYSNKIKYTYGIFSNEEEKRILGYSKCSHNIILLVDSDEFFTIDNNAINNFIKSKKYVAFFSIFNMNRIDISFDKKVEKFVMFKKKYINPTEHLDYTWLIGCKQNKLNQDYMYLKEAMGTIYHQTLNRNKYNNIIKFIFYTALHYHINNINVENNLFGNYNLDELLQKISMTDIHNIFYHSRITLIGIPEIDKILYRNENMLINIDKYKNNHMEAYFQNNSLFLKNTPYYFYFNMCDTINSINIIFENVKNVSITIYEINLNEKYLIYNHTCEVNDNNIRINQHITKKQNHFCTVMMINCLETISDDYICIIKDMYSEI